MSQGRPAQEDAPPVAALRAAGAVLIGKAGMHEIGLGITGLNTIHGTPRNPFNLSHHTGGSSSGVAALVASGICPVALGEHSSSLSCLARFKLPIEAGYCCMRSGSLQCSWGYLQLAAPLARRLDPSSVRLLMKGAGLTVKRTAQMRTMCF